MVWATGSAGGSRECHDGLPLRGALLTGRQDASATANEAGRIEQTEPFELSVVQDTAAVAGGAIRSGGRSWGLRHDEGANQQVEGGAMLADRIAIESRQAIAPMRHVAGDFNFIRGPRC